MLRGYYDTYVHADENRYFEAPFWFDEGIQCFVARIEYATRCKQGRLVVPLGNQPDLTGVVSFFKKIDPQVLSICVAARDEHTGAELDVSGYYQSTAGEWKSEYFVDKTASWNRAVFWAEKERVDECSARAETGVMTADSLLAEMDRLTRLSEEG